MQDILKPTLLGALIIMATTKTDASDIKLPIPPQDKGLPYTRSARPAARKAIGKNIVFYPGSRYAYAYGYRTRLDSEQPLKGKAIEKDGQLYVPAKFANIIIADPADVKADKAPEYLADRFVHTLLAPAVKLRLSKDKQITHQGQVYLRVESLAKAAKKPFVKHPNGLVIIGEEKPEFFKDEVLTKAVVTLFDTPETLADPSIATEYIPLLKRQGPWTKWVKHTPEQLKMLEGPETEWPLVPFEKFDFTGFNKQMLGSKVPAPGVYPRLLFSDADLPMLRKRLKHDRIMAFSYAEMKALLKGTWLDPKTDDGKVFDRLASGKPLELSEVSDGDRKRSVPIPFGQLKGFRQGIYSSHLPYISHCIVALQFQALIEDDEKLGKKAAMAAATWCRFMEDGVDKLYAMSDSEYGVDYGWANGGETAYRMMAAADHMNLPFLLDFGGKWMSDKQKDDIRRLIAKATYGRADSHAAGSIRWEENNHCTWHTTIFLSQMAIEGLEGYDPETMPRAIRTIQAFSEFGIDPKGVVFESNGKSGAGFMNILLNMVCVARRGGPNFFGHPHWRQLLKAQVQCSAPDGSLTVTSGTYAGGPLEGNVVMFIKAFYPGNKYGDWLLSKRYTHWDKLELDPKKVAEYINKLENRKIYRIRVPIFTSPLSQRCTLYDTDFKPTDRKDLGLPLTFDSKVHGMFSAYSQQTENAAWINLMVRDNGYLGAGHQHADSGIFHFSADKVNWIQESPLNTLYDGNLHNLVLIDGKSADDRPAPSGKYLGSADTPEISSASVDMKRTYDYTWIQQLMLWDKAAWWAKTPLSEQGVEFDDYPTVVAAFKGTQKYKMRNWWPSYNFSNWIPTCRAPYNPVQYAKRSVALVRGKHPYGVIMDNLKKDSKKRHYQWTACPGRGVWKSDYASVVGKLPDNQMVLGYDGPKARKRNYKFWEHSQKPEALVGKKNSKQLLVCILNKQNPGKYPMVDIITRDGPFNQRAKKAMPYDNIVINHQGTDAKFRVLLIPFKRGQELPKITYDEKSQTATVAWKDQVDKLQFKTKDNLTTVALKK